MTPAERAALENERDRNLKPMWPIDFTKIRILTGAEAIEHMDAAMLRAFNEPQSDEEGYVRPLYHRNDRFGYYKTDPVFQNRPIQDDDVAWHCRRCDKIFTRIDRNWHELRECDIRRGAECDVCLELFPDKEMLKDHTKQDTCSAPSPNVDLTQGSSRRPSR